MKLGSRDKEAAALLRKAYDERQRFTLTGGGLSADFVPESINYYLSDSFENSGRPIEVEWVQASDLKVLTTWNGPEDGLPPVGPEVEVLWSASALTYVTAQILAHDGDRAVFRFTSGERKGEYQADSLFFSTVPHNLPIFRPIGTTEKRLHKIRNACTAISRDIELYNKNLDCSAAMRATVEAMIDAGYVKP